MSLFTDDMTVQVENPKGSTKNPGANKQQHEVTRDKVNIQSQVISQKL